MNLSPKEKAQGKANAQEALEVSRRDFMKGAAVAGGVSASALGGFYFGYSQIKNPLRVGVIGTGDEGSVLISNINPDYLQVVAIADIRPFNQWRAFHGDPANLSARQGLMSVYGWKSETEAHKHVKVYKEDYNELLKDPNVEAVIIAVPLHLHAEMAIAAMKAGKHVLCEKLMAHNIAQCKEMARTAKKTNRVLAVGHQRHYSVLYDNAVHLIKQGTIGNVHHIRAQWHRGNLPGRDSWHPPLPDKWVNKVKDLTKKYARAKDLDERDSLFQQLQIAEQRAADINVDAKKYGYQDRKLGDLEVPALQELIHWRLWNRTGGGLMAELGSHQLDAAGIFVSALRSDNIKAKPLQVTAMGGRHIFPPDRDCDDHVYCSLEFPAPGFDEDPNKRIVVNYSSINGNNFGGYGEIVMGDTGTMILDREQELMLFTDRAKTKVKVSKDAEVDSYDTGGGQTAEKQETSGPVSRGYREEMEHWAWCIKNPSPDNQPRCNPEVALSDAILALTTNIAIKTGQRIKFEEDWFDVDKDATPEEDILGVKNKA